MAGSDQAPAGPDLTLGVPTAELADGSMLAGHVGDKPVLLARRNSEFFAVDGTCTHYGGPLPEGLMVGDTVRCPWHHACFDLWTGVAARPRSRRAGRVTPEAVIIVGAGAAGESAAEAVREEGYPGSVVLFDPDPEA